MSSGSTNAGQSAGNAVKQAFGTVHGAGEALRGNINNFFDSAAGTPNAREQATAEKGVREMETGNPSIGNAGVSPVDSSTASYHTGSTTGYRTTGGSATTDSGHGFAAEGTGSTNHGPHQSNLANKLDPRVDSDRDGRANTSGLR